MFRIPSSSKSRSESAAVRGFAVVPRLLVKVGVVLYDVAPLPSWPLDPHPQHETEPLSRMAQVWAYPPETVTAIRPVPRLLVKVGVVLPVVLP